MGAAGIGAGLGAATGLIEHNQKLGQYNRDKELAAQMEANSPWTGVHGQMPTAPGSALGSAFQGGVGGLSMGQNIGANANALTGKNLGAQASNVEIPAPTQVQQPTLFEPYKKNEKSNDFFAGNYNFTPWRK